MKSNIVFHISERMIKFMQVTAQKVVGADVLTIEKQDDGQISDSLKAFIKERRLSFTESRVTVLIPRSRAILRHMVFPSHKEDEIRSMINLQVGSHIPYVREEVEIDFQVLSRTPDGYSKVAVVIIPQEIAMRYWKIFSDAQVPVDGITISSVGLWLLYQQQDLSDKPGAIFDLDVDHCEICLCDKSHWFTSREIPGGFAKMQQEGYAEILKQWELTQQSVSGERLAERMEAVYLVSSAMHAQTLEAEMAQKQGGLTINKILLTEALSLRGGQWPSLMTEGGVSMAPLAGVALSPLKPPIDLVPSAIRQTQQRHVYKRQLIISGAWVAAALVSLGLALGIGFFRKNLRLVQLENQLHDAKRESSKIKDQLQKTEDIENMLKERLVFSDMARVLARILPSEIYLVNVSISAGHALSFEGVSPNTAEVNRFQKDMVDSKNFSKVNLDYVNKRVTPQGEVDYFKITCVFNAVKENNAKT